MPTDHAVASEAASESPRARDTRFNLRADAQQSALIRRAAQATHRTVTDFILDTASTAAERVLADRRWFMLDDASWTAFTEMLERPAIAKPRLAALLEQSSDLFEP